MTAEQRRERSARMWKIIVAALSGATFATIVVASCLDRDEDAMLSEPGVTQTTSADLPPGGLDTASTTDTSSGIDHGAAGVPADLPGDANATTTTDPTPTPNQSTTDSSSGVPMSRAPVMIENVENMSVNVTPNMSTATPPAADAAPVAGAPIAGHAAHQDNDPNALVQRGLANTASGVATATSDDGGVPPPATYWMPPGPYILQGVPTAGAPTVPPPTPAAPTTMTPSVQGGPPVRGGPPLTGGTPPSAPSPTTPLVQPMR
jgi:hypothetical protein